MLRSCILAVATIVVLHFASCRATRIRVSTLSGGNRSSTRSGGGFVCPEQCLECCKDETIGAIGWWYSDSHFKCILKAPLESAVPPDGCSKPSPRISVPYQAKTACPVSEEDKRNKVLDTLRQCSKKTKCCCRKEPMTGVEQVASELNCLKVKKSDIQHSDTLIQRGSKLFRKSEKQFEWNMHDGCRRKKYQKNGKNGLPHKRYNDSMTYDGCCLEVNNNKHCTKWEKVWSCGFSEQTGIEHKRVVRGTCIGDESTRERLTQAYCTDDDFDEGSKDLYTQDFAHARIFGDQCPQNWGEYVEKEGDCVCLENCEGIPL